MENLNVVELKQDELWEVVEGGQMEDRKETVIAALVRLLSKMSLMR